MDRATVTATRRLRVTTWTSGDLAGLHRLHRDPEVMRHMTSGVEDLDQTRRRLTTFLAEQLDPGWTRWRLEDRDGRLVGRAGLRTPHGGAHRDLGYLLAREVWGVGHATEVTRALLTWHHEHPRPGISTRVRAHVVAEHGASIAVLVKTGFRLVGTDPADDRRLVYETAGGRARP